MEHEIVNNTTTTPTSSKEVFTEGFLENQDSAIPTEGMAVHINESVTHAPTLPNKQNEECIPTPLSKQNGEDIENDSDEELEHKTERQNQEVSLDVRKCAAKFADNTVIRNYCWLLKSFMSNTVATNHYILCMLQRICKDYELEPMLFQVLYLILII